MKRSALFAAAALLLLIAAFAAKSLLVGLPDLPERTAPGAFDTERAMARLARILGDERPHPVDTAANDAVRARLVAELRALGLDPRVTDDFVCNASRKGRAVSCARVRNVVATMGPDDGRHVLMASHYDSTPAGPGAADDGIGMAVMLETAALLRRERPERPVTFLFNEGEEVGLLGARAFLERDPIAPRVDSLVNLEARGTTGRAMMFETSRPNAVPIGHYARAAERPAANSMSTDFYRMIPNSTDVAVFDERDWVILNLAIIGNETRYHSPGDTLAALDPRSVRHMGEQAVGLVRSLTSEDRTSSGGERLYADILGRHLLVLPAGLGLALVGLIAIGTAYAAWRQRVGVGRGLLALSAALGGAAALAFAGHALVSLLREGAFWRGHPEVTSLAIDASAIAAAIVVLATLGREAAISALRRAFWTGFVLIGVALAPAVTGATIFFLLPPALFLLGLLVARWKPQAEMVGSLAGAIALFLTLGPIHHLAQVLLDLGSGWMFAPLAALLAFPFLIELRPAFHKLRARTAAAGALFLLLLAWAAAASTPAYSQDRKQRFGIEYVWDAGERSGRWMIVNDGAVPPPETGRFEDGVEVPWSTTKRWARPAPALAVAPPRVEQVASRPASGGRLVTIRLFTEGAESVTLRAPAKAPLLAAGAAGAPRRMGKTGSDDHFVLRCHGRGCDGRSFDLLIGTERPIPFQVIGTRSGLPAAAAPIQRARPPLAAPQYAPDQTISIGRAVL